MPDEVDWDARADASSDEPEYDRPGTSYNNVALPSSMATAADRHNLYAENRDRVKGHNPKTLLTGGAAVPAAATPASAPAPAVVKPRRSAPGGALIPPQLRRPNVSTEDQAAMRTKRSKPSSAT